ncbi:MAG: hypothetical protein IPP74_09255 [Alphaproteobacteria bacterium]|nr:hypothetical protein [Alphaproteobacteria bacterium]
MKENTIRILSELITKQSEFLQDLIEKNQKENNLDQSIIGLYDYAFMLQQEDMNYIQAADLIESTRESIKNSLHNKNEGDYEHYVTNRCLKNLYGKELRIIEDWENNRCSLADIIKYFALKRFELLDDVRWNGDQFSIMKQNKKNHSKAEYLKKKLYADYTDTNPSHFESHTLKAQQKIRQMNDRYESYSKALIELYQYWITPEGQAETNINLNTHEQQPYKDEIRDFYSDAPLHDIFKALVSLHENFTGEKDSIDYAYIAARRTSDWFFFDYYIKLQPNTFTTQNELSTIKNPEPLPSFPMMETMIKDAELQNHHNVETNETRVLQQQKQEKKRLKRQKYRQRQKIKKNLSNQAEEQIKVNDDPSSPLISPANIAISVKNVSSEIIPIKKEESPQVHASEIIIEEQNMEVPSASAHDNINDFNINEGHNTYLNQNEERKSDTDSRSYKAIIKNRTQKESHQKDHPSVLNKPEKIWINRVPIPNRMIDTLSRIWDPSQYQTVTYREFAQVWERLNEELRDKEKTGSSHKELKNTKGNSVVSKYTSINEKIDSLHKASKNAKGNLVVTQYNYINEKTGSSHKELKNAKGNLVESEYNYINEKTGSSHKALKNAEGKIVGGIFAHGNNTTYGPRSIRHMRIALESIGYNTETVRNLSRSAIQTI